MKKSFSLWQKGEKNYPAASLESYQMKMNILWELHCTYFISMTEPCAGGYIKMTATLTLLNSVLVDSQK